MQENFTKSGKILRLLRGMTACMLIVFATGVYSASKTVLVLGDSLSAEYGITRGAGWVSLLEQRLKAERIDAAIINASISGETTSGGRTRLPVLLNQYKPNIVVIELGGNDGLRGLPLSAAETNLRAMIEASQKAKAKVLLVGMQIPPNYGRDYTEKFVKMYPRLSQDTKTSLVPFLLQGIADRSQFFQGDRIHPLAEAHPIMLNNIWPHLKPLLTR